MRKREVLIVQHVPWERPASLGRTLTGDSIPFTCRTLLETTELDVAAELDRLAGVVILGGPMGAGDVERHPGLAVEADLVRAAVDRDVPLFGVCLGHQIIATALGASLHPGAAREVGVGTVDVIADDVLGPAGGTQPVVHWHHDVVDAPAGARVIASTAQTPNQAFRVGDTVFATQFHLEVDEPLLAEWITVPEMAADLPPGTDLLGDFRAVRPRIEAAAQTAFGAFAAAVRARM